MSADDVRGEEYEAAKPTPTNQPVPLESGADAPTHLPECDVLHMTDEDDGAFCICRQLRACEQRLALQWLVTDREQQEAEERAYKAGLSAAREAVSSREELAEARLLGYREGYYEGVQAAREAVEFMPAEPSWEAQEERIAALAAIAGLVKP